MLIELLSKYTVFVIFGKFFKYEKLALKNRILHEVLYKKIMFWNNFLFFQFTLAFIYFLAEYSISARAEVKITIVKNP